MYNSEEFVEGDIVKMDDDTFAIISRKRNGRHLTIVGTNIDISSPDTMLKLYKDGRYGAPVGCSNGRSCPPLKIKEKLEDDVEMIFTLNNKYRLKIYKNSKLYFNNKFKVTPEYLEEGEYKFLRGCDMSYGYCRSFNNSSDVFSYIKKLSHRIKEIEGFNGYTPCPLQIFEAPLNYPNLILILEGRFNLTKYTHVPGSCNGYMVCLRNVDDITGDIEKKFFEEKNDAYNYVFDIQNKLLLELAA